MIMIERRFVFRLIVSNDFILELSDLLGLKIELIYSLRYRIVSNKFSKYCKWLKTLKERAISAGVRLFFLQKLFHGGEVVYKIF